MFRGIDPDGLRSLANMVELGARAVRHQSRIALDVLDRNGRSTDVVAISAVVGRIENWGSDTAGTLRWRADTIRDGQTAGLNVIAIARAEFAAEAVFSIDTIDKSYREWVAERQASKERADGAVAHISDSLSQGWTDWDITNNDLHNVWATLGGLSADELDRVIAALSSTQLERWIEEMGNRINGYSQSEKQQVFTMLASNSNGASLGKIHDAILAGGTREEAIDFGIAIQVAGVDQTIVDFVAYTVAAGLAAHKYSGVAPALAVAGIDDATAIDTAVGSLILSDGALALIVADSLATTGTLGIVATVNPLDSLGSAMSRVTDPELRISAFTAVTRLATEAKPQLHKLLRARHGIIDAERLPVATLAIRDAEKELLTLSARILVADADTIIQALAIEIDPDGTLTSAFLYGLVDRGLSEQMGRIADALRGGEHVNPGAFSELGTDPDYRYPHAQNLAFFAGTLNNALDAYADDAKDDITAIARVVAGTSLLLGPLAGSITTGALTTAGEGMLEYYLVTGTQDNIDRHLAAVSDLVTERLQPRLSTVGEPLQLGESPRWWDFRYRMIRGFGTGS